MGTITENGRTMTIADKAMQFNGTQDVLEMMVSAFYTDQCEAMIIYRESLPSRFFDLKSGFAGDILQKFSNYRMKLAIVGDFSDITSKSLKDFIYECNNGSLIFFKGDIASAVSALAR